MTSEFSNVLLQVRPDLKPASMATVEAEFEKHPQRNDWQANRVTRCVLYSVLDRHGSQQSTCLHAPHTVAAACYEV